MTITVDEEVAERAQVWAARHDTSVSRLVGRLLAEYLEREEHYDSAMAEFFSRGAQPLKPQGTGYPARDELHGRIR